MSLCFEPVSQTKVTMLHDGNRWAIRKFYYIKNGSLVSESVFCNNFFKAVGKYIKARSCR